MKPGEFIAERFRVCAPLEVEGRASGGFVTDRPRGRRPVWVLKWIPGSTAALRDELRRDVLELATLRHESLALPVRFGLDRERARGFLLRPYVEGSDLFRASQGKAPDEMVPWLLSAAEALGVLHRFGLVHGNVKPSNVLVPHRALFARRARMRRVVLCDPDCRREPAIEEASVRPPEREPGDVATVSSDLYSLGALFYFVLTRTPPDALGDGFPVRLTDRHPEIPVDLERCVMKLLSPDPARRYQRCAELVADLRRLGKSSSRMSPDIAEGFFGRRAEVDRCVSRLFADAAPAAVAVTGEAGVGKSALLQRVALEAQLAGLEVAHVRCYPRAASSFDPLGALVDSILPNGPRGRALRRRYRRCWASLRESESDGRVGSSDSARRARLIRDVLDVLFDVSSREPTLLVVDEAHFADPFTVDLLAMLVREIFAASRERDRGAGRRPSLLLSLRSESPFRPAARPLFDALSAPGSSHHVEELGPLGSASAEAWVRAVVDFDLFPGGSSPLDRFLRHGGLPIAIRAAIRVASSGDRTDPASVTDLARVHAAYLSRRTPSQRALLDALAVVGRPADLALLERCLPEDAGKPADAIDALDRDRLLIEEHGRWFFRHGSFADWLVDNLDERDRQRLHGRVASALEAYGDGTNDERARHWLASDEPGRGIDVALAAARECVRDHEPRTAVFFYSQVLDLAPDDGVATSSIVEEAAEAHAGSGDYPGAMRLVEGLLRSGGRSDRSARWHGRMGVFAHRAGDLAEAVRHLEESLSLFGAASDVETLRERLRTQSELAEIAANQGDYVRAESISQRALAELDAPGVPRDDPEIQREEIVLLATCGHVRLRRFEYDEARTYFERSLEIAGDPHVGAEQALVLNNLGILHIQEDRYALAIDCYRKAEKLSRRLADDQSLAPIYCNLSVLHAKTGDLASADEALGRASRCEARCDSRRTRFLYLHTRGMVDHLAGRYSSAIESFRASIELGEELGDDRTVAFDLVYLGECHLLRGEIKAGQRTLERLSSIELGRVEPLASMRSARMALAAAFRGDDRAVRAAIDACGPTAERRIRYIEAWNQLLCGWAERVVGHLEGASARLESARGYFAKTGVEVGHDLAALELAAGDLDRGRTAIAARRLRRIGARMEKRVGEHRHPMLAARYLAYETRRVLSERRPDYTLAASMLVEAESHLIGRHLSDLEAMVRGLRRRLQSATLADVAPSVWPRRGEGDAAARLESLALAKAAAEDLLRRFEDELGKERAAELRRHVDDLDEFQRDLRRAVDGRDAAGPGPIAGDAIVGRSSAIRELIALLRRFAVSPLPVLVTGETGTGKELVARAIHGESPRRGAAFVSLSCAALPEELLEAELFGYARGAFSGADRDHAGLLRAADGGSFFFDEVAELPIGLQGKILRLLDRPSVRPLGESDEVEIDVRFLFSTQRDLRALVDEGRFRSDLYYRIGALIVSVPPLRDRLEDLSDLIDHFGRSVAGERDVPPFDAESLRVLSGYPWPGNVRELRNLVSRLALSDVESISADDARRALGCAPSGAVFSSSLLRSRPLGELLAQLERDYLVQLYDDSSGDIEAMARTLGIRRRALYDRFRRLGLSARKLRRR